jgi:hypothetical protein
MCSRQTNPLHVCQLSPSNLTHLALGVIFALLGSSFSGSALCPIAASVPRERNDGFRAPFDRSGTSRFREGPRVRIPVPFKAVIGWSAL